jgi:RsmE family RNA methyltransferase
VNLILLEPFECDAEGRVSLSDARAQHIRNVLRAVVGQVIRIGLINGSPGEGTIVAADDRVVTLACRFEEAPPPRPRIDLLLALPRPKVMRRLWAQLAALGVGRIILTNAERVERPYFDTHVLAPETYRPLLVEGLQQARDTHLPAVSIHRQFRVLVEDDLETLCGSARRLVAQPGVARDVRDALRDPGNRRVLVAIGPEGGWNAFELRLLETHGFCGVGMGPRTLRSDTACIAMLAIVADALAARR